MRRLSRVVARVGILGSPRPTGKGAEKRQKQRDARGLADRQWEYLFPGHEISQAWRAPARHDLRTSRKGWETSGSEDDGGDCGESGWSDAGHGRGFQIVRRRRRGKACYRHGHRDGWGEVRYFGRRDSFGQNKNLMRARCWTLSPWHLVVLMARRKVGSARQRCRSGVLARRDDAGRHALDGCRHQRQYQQ